jgi:hypothetical protein
MFSAETSSESDSDDIWVTDVAEAEWFATADSDLTREMNAAPALFEKWQPAIPFTCMQAWRWNGINSF